MDIDRGAGLLHRLTSYRPDREWDERADDPRLRHDLVQNDPATLPPPVKEYPSGLPVTELPRELPRPSASASAVLAGAPARASASASTRRARSAPPSSFNGAGAIQPR